MGLAIFFDSNAIGITEDELLQTILLELAPRTVFIGEAVALGVVRCEVEDQAFAQTLGELCLIVGLLIVVGIISVTCILERASWIDVPSRVVASPILGFIFGAKSVPRDASALLPPEGEQLENGIFSEVATLDEVGGTHRTTTVDISVCCRLSETSF